nr:MAG TPA: hypothetical protein [Bacteriophage sp.]DAY34982.1 MAG TPA: hypothetical protein [Bacteriophage sp.]
MLIGGQGKSCPLNFILILYLFLMELNYDY